MTRHNDISNAHARLEGEGWHIIQPPQRAARKSKSKCTYYIKGGGCRQKIGGCQGAGGCSMYYQKNPI